MESLNGAPWQIRAAMADWPSQNIGKLYAKIKPPFIPVAVWFRVDGWGQLCDGCDHKDMVHLMLYNKFPNRGKGWTYVAWRAEPDNPEACKSQLSGRVKNPQPYSGVAYA